MNYPDITVELNHDLPHHSDFISPNGYNLPDRKIIEAIYSWIDENVNGQPMTEYDFVRITNNYKLFLNRLLLDETVANLYVANLSKQLTMIKAYRTSVKV